MKIDFHIHTKKCKEGDGSKRFIQPSEFIEQMNNNNVKMCAITNHNTISKEEFKEIQKLGPDFTLFPGIELDVIFNDKSDSFHIIIICDPKVLDQFDRIFDNDPNRNYDEFALSYKEFISKINELSPEHVMIIPHFLDKDKKRALNINDKEKLINDLKEYVVILEPGKLQTMGIINSHNEVSLLGSDVRDWSKYSECDLPEIKFRITTFSKFYELAKNPRNFIKQELENTTKYTVKINENNDTISLYRDINVVFGEKGSGKTYLISNYFLKFFQEEGCNVYFHEGKDYGEKYCSIVDNYTDSIEIDKNVRRSVGENFDNIIKYSEGATQNFIKEMMKYHKEKHATRNANAIKKTDAIFIKRSVLDFNEIKTNFYTNFNKIDDVMHLNDERDNENSHKHSLAKELNNLKLELSDKMKENYQNIFTINKTNKLLDMIKNTVTKKTGKVSSVGTIGFSDLVNKRYHLIKQIKNIQEQLENVKRTKHISLGELPNKGAIRLDISIVAMDPSYSWNSKDRIFNKNTVKFYRTLIKKIYSFAITDFKDINSYFDTSERETNYNDFVEAIIRKKVVVKRHNGLDWEVYTPSEGEKAILSISSLLENKDYDCYLFDEIERGLGNKYISDYLIPKLDNLRNQNKLIVLSTHNANIAVNTLPSQWIYCDYKNEKDNGYYQGNMYSGELYGTKDYSEMLNWEEKALDHLEGSQKMFNRRKNLYGI